MRIAVLLTCHNRREKTLQCLRSLAAQTLPDGLHLETWLVDDGSKDGTQEAVLGEFPDTHVVRGDGSLYWCGGMRAAWREAAPSEPDFYLLLNDDTLLLPHALAGLLEITSSPRDRVIAVAAIRDPDRDEATYGGIRIASGLVAATGDKEVCDTFNGNAVMIPDAVFRELGMLHDAYTHGMGDFDYGYQATRRGIKVVQSAEFLGECPRNPMQGSWRDKSLDRKQRMRILASPKGLPFREWMIFNRRNAGWMWPIRTVSPYVRVVLGL